jgi:F-type H+-transporting ATPase subunit delta
MAMRGASARRYAEAAFELAVEQNALDAWARDLHNIAAFVSEPQVAGLLSSGRVPREERQKLLAVALEQQVGPLALNLARLLDDRGKLVLAPDIARAFDEMADERQGRAHATVTTAVALSEDDQRAVTQRLSQLTGKQVTVTSVVDESIIGGIVARIGDQLIDGSTRSRLVALKRRLQAAQ